MATKAQQAVLDRIAGGDKLNVRRSSFGRQKAIVHWWFDGDEGYLNTAVLNRMEEEGLIVRDNSRKTDVAFGHYAYTSAE